MLVILEFSYPGSEMLPGRTQVLLGFYLVIFKAKGINTWIPAQKRYRNDVIVSVTGST
jgi:hypothetical protein